jgi:pimeloyl-ACP methyl ester carboxylesterase
MKKVSVQGVSLAAVDQGAGLPVVLVHGFPLDHRMWAAQIDGLSKRCRVIAPDLRGFGQSDATNGAVSMEQMANDVAGLLDALGVHEPVVLAGLSMGGYVAMAFQKKHPQRLRGLVLCDTRAAADSPEAAQGRRQTAEKVLAEGTAVLAESMIPKLLSPRTLHGRPEIANGLREVILATCPRGAAAAARGMAERPDSTPGLSAIGCPSLVLVGTEDAISTVQEMQSIAEKIPGAKFVTIEHAGHMSPVEQPAEVTAAIAAFVAEIRESETATGS